jgi:hypothetical protein
MAEKNPYTDERRTQHGPVTVKTWPAKVFPAPQPLPSKKK